MEPSALKIGVAGVMTGKMMTIVRTVLSIWG